MLTGRGFWDGQAIGSAGTRLTRGETIEAVGAPAAVDRGGLRGHVGTVRRKPAGMGAPVLDRA